jgi:hypothetical protein
LLGKAKTVKGIAKETIQKIDMIINALQGEQAKCEGLSSTNKQKQIHFKLNRFGQRKFKWSSD